MANTKAQHVDPYENNKENIGPRLPKADRSRVLSVSSDDGALGPSVLSSSGLQSERSGSVPTNPGNSPHVFWAEPAYHTQYIEYLNGDDWDEVIDDDDALPKKILEYCGESLREGERSEYSMYELADEITPLTNGSFCENVWACKSGNTLLYVIKAWKSKSPMNAFKKHSISDQGSLSPMKRICLFATRESAFDRLARLKELEWQLKKQDALHVILPNRLFIINNEKYLEVIEGANGICLERYIVENSEKNAALVTAMMKEVGRRFACFHKGAHAVHGDASPGNVFCDINSGQYSLIDCQSVTFVGDVLDSKPEELFLEEVETFISYLQRGAKSHSEGECGEGACSLRHMSFGGLNISGDLKRVYAKAFVDGYIDGLGEDGSSWLKGKLLGYRGEIS